MNKEDKKFDILPSQDQLSLYGYEKYFKFFIKLFEKKKLPNVILLTGLKGSGKSTFAYHFINYLFSLNEENKYSLADFTINSKNKSYKNLCNKTLPNFFLLENKDFEENIKIDNVKNLLAFLNKSSLNPGKRIILIDNAEYLNVNSSNALLKSLEEPTENTFFFIIHNSSKKILNTIKSRCIQFRFHFTFFQKKEILSNILSQYKSNININEISNNFYYDSPGNIFKYLKFLIDNKIDFSEDKLSCLSYLISSYKKEKEPQLLNFISLLIEMFYNELSIKNSEKLNNYFFSKHKILKQIDNLKKFNLDKNNFFITLQNTLKNES